MGQSRIGPETSLLNKLLLNIPGDQVSPQYDVEAEERTNEIAPRKEAVSVYGVGPTGVALRQAATSAAMKQLEKALLNPRIPANQAAQIRAVVEKYPRVMAHLKNIVTSDKKSYMRPYSKGIFTPSIDNPGRGSIAMYLNNSRGNDAAPTFVHELMHAAQNIGLKEKFSKLYNVSSTARKMFEQSAEAGAARRVLPESGRHMNIAPNERSITQTLRAMGFLK